MAVKSIIVKELCVGYDDSMIVNHLNMQVSCGKITVIIGPNGCGKSTILKAMGRILKPRGGAVYLNGEDIHHLSTKQTAQRMAVLPQSPQAPGGLTVGELVAYGRFPHQTGFGKLTVEDKKVIAWALEVTSLTDLESTLIHSLSGGQRQRVWIAMALAQQTDLILLDEPTTYLDLAYQLELLELLRQLNKEQMRTIVMVLHDLNLAARFADYMLAVRDGAIIAYGKPENVMTPAVLKETFGINAHIVREPCTGRMACVSYDLIRESVALKRKECV